MPKIWTLLLTFLMAGGGASSQGSAEAHEITEEEADYLVETTPEESACADAPPEKRRPGRPRGSTKKQPLAVRIVTPDPVSTRSSSRDVDVPALHALVSGMQRQMQQLMQGLSATSAARSAATSAAMAAPNPDDPDDDDDYSSDSSQLSNPPRREIPDSGLIPHIPRQPLAFWDRHIPGTPLNFKGLPDALRSAMSSNARDRLEASHTYTALTIAASLLDVLVAVTEGQRAYAQFGVELLMNYLIPMLARRVDTLQQEGPLRDAFSMAQDPRSHYFVADPDTSLGLLQRVSAARVQSLLTAASRTGGRDGSSGSNSTNRRGNPSQPRQSGGGSGGSQRNNNNNRGNANNGGSSTNGSGRGGRSRDRNDSRARGSSRDGASARSNSAAARGGDQA